MIHRTLPTWQTKSWQEELQQLILCPKTLIERLELDESLIDCAVKANQLFPLKATESYVSRIKKGNPQDPLLLQILPLGAEFDESAGYSRDPLHEKEFQPVPGVIHKYQSRALFVAATQCAIHCRYCFRRHFPYSDNQLNREQWHTALKYIQQTPSLNEVILSGGDPLSISDAQLTWLIQHIAEIPHITRVRVHSRYPIILPSRISDNLINALTATHLKVIMVIHCNHAQEIDSEVASACLRMKQANITLLNQSVLLKGVNDNSEVLRALSEALFSINTLPYYLHTLDKVMGASHFSVSLDHAREVYRELLTLLPGYLIPKLVTEQPFEKSKTLLAI